MRYEFLKLAANAWQDLGIEVNSPANRLVEAFRSLSIKYAIEPKYATSAAPKFHTKAVAYRFLNSIPIPSKVRYKPTDILPLLRPVEQSLDTKHLRAARLLDVSIATMERAQKSFEQPYVNYVINVHYCLRKHVVRRRYSEFVALHSALSRKMPVIPLVRYVVRLGLSKVAFTDDSIDSCPRNHGTPSIQ